MFQSSINRYITRGVNEAVPLELQVFCWKCIDRENQDHKVVMDYLQIFEINPDVNRGRVEIVHRQEEPFFIDYYDIKLTNELQNCSIKRLRVMDDGTNQTMLLPEEY